MKKQSFITGAVILMIANSISKILGAVFKIPLTYILEEEGMAVFNIAFQVYIMFLSFVISGIPLAVSKSVAEFISKGKSDYAHKTVKIAVIMLILIGILGSILLCFGAEFFAVAMREENAVLAIRLISPSIFFVALGTAFKSYFQGSSNMIPTAISQVVEAVIKLVAGYALAVSFAGVAKTAGGAIFGVTCGEIVATMILIIGYMWDKRHIKVRVKRKEAQEIIKSTVSIALPVLCASVVSNALSVADTTLIRQRLVYSGMADETARFVYGAYTGYAMTLFNLPVGILATLGVSLLPIVAGAFALNNMNRVKKMTEIGLKTSMLLALPCAVVMFKMPGEMLEILFRNTASAQMLRMMSPCIVMICIVQILSTVLQAADKILLPYIFMFIGSAIKIGIGYFLIGIPQYNIYGAIIASNVSYFVVVIMFFSAVRKVIGLKCDYTAIIIKPVIAAAVMAVVIYLMPHEENNILSTFLILISAGGSYILTLILTNAVTVNEVKRLVMKR